MDTNAQMTVVSVHSPLIQFSTSGSYYTSYAISLKSNNPCFTHSFSQVRRRYSEFLHLRRQILSHHPTTKAPKLPPKNFFNRFDDTLIEERRTGLQKFLNEVLSIPVYLSDKSLHMFLQTSCSMSQICEECVGDIPAPQLMDVETSIFSGNSDSSSSGSSENLDKKGFTNSDDYKIIKSDGTESKYSVSVHSLPNSLKQQAYSNLRKSLNTKPCMIPKRQGSLDSSPCSSVSSLDAGYCSSLEFNKSRRVSFNEKVTVAIVYNQLWNIVTEPIRTSA